MPKPDLYEPPAIKRLPFNKAGYRVPWFVAVIDGEPDFRVVRPGGVSMAHVYRLCWICGGGLSARKSFVIGPMCVVNRVSAEPPMHRDCARYSVAACPFLTVPHMRRRDTSDVADRVAPAGVMIERNPGVAAIWTTKHYSVFRAEQGHDGYLFGVGEPESVEWFAEGRHASREEVMLALDSGFPALRDACLLEPTKVQQAKALEHLNQELNVALTLLPA